MPLGVPPSAGELEELPASAVAGEILHRVFRPKGPDGTARSPWWFASVPTESDQVGGRFDLVPPNGACYFALSAVGAVLEAMQGFEVGIIPLEELSVRRRVELIAPDSAPEAADLSAPEVYGLVGITAALWAGGDEDRARCPFCELRANDGLRRCSMLGGAHSATGSNTTQRESSGQ